MPAPPTNTREYHVAEATRHTKAEAAHLPDFPARAAHHAGLAIHHLATALALPIQRVAATRFNR